MTIKHQNVKLMFNTEHHSHQEEFTKLLSDAKRLDCVVAFAKHSGLKLIIENLTSSLQDGLKARFVISLDFYLTDPAVLRKFLELGKKHDSKLYLSESESTFHPKIYALTYSSGCAMMVGSANLTSGGLLNNYEASAVINDPTGNLAREVSNHIDELIENGELVEATTQRINEYERQHRLHHAFQSIKNRHFEQAKNSTNENTLVLEKILREMKDDFSEEGFSEQKIQRQRNLGYAFKKIKELASLPPLNADEFLVHYKQLIDFFHSGGLDRGKTIIARQAAAFQEALVAILQLEEPAPRDAYQLLLDHFQNINRAGVNVLTEILHAIDNKRFAVMNQNAVSGLSLANINIFPSKPHKGNVSAELYALYCHKAALVKDELKLNDFGELDALFNYAYWKPDEVESEEGD